MSRGLSSPNVTASTALHVRPLVFVEMQFDAGTERVHNGVGTYVWGSQTWTGIGAIGQIGTIEEGIELSPYGITLKLNALNPSLLAIAEGEEVFNRRIRIYIGLLDENGQLTDTPFERWSGWMSAMSIELGGENDGIELAAESDLRFFAQSNGSRFTDEDQQARFSGDVAFEFLDQIIDSRIIWGPDGTAVSPGVDGAKKLPGRTPPPRTTPGTTPKRGVGG